MTDLDMGDTAMEGNFPDDIFRFPNLQILNLKLNSQLTGYLPKSNWISSLRKLDLSLSNFLGEIPYSIGNLFFLKVLHIGFCNFTGSIPTSIGNLTRATEIVFASNHFTGQLPYHLNGPIDPFQWPNSLQDVRLEENEIRGTIPNSIFQLVNLTILDLSSNDLVAQSDLTSSQSYKSFNFLIFQITAYSHLPLLPISLSNIPYLALRFCVSLIAILEGHIHNTFANASHLRSLDLYSNKLEGPLPRSLAKYIKLEVVNVENNMISDSFPCWMGSLSELKILVLRSNQFDCPPCNSNITFPFQALRIIDLSHTEFTGFLPRRIFPSMEAMKNVDEQGRLEYMGRAFCDESITVAMKGHDFQLQNIFVMFRAMDFSSNRFHGEISEVLGNFKSLKVLNLSHNSLTGNIPVSFENMTALESLDLSFNKLDGRIPEQLLSVTALALLNLSYNRLWGRIPRGNQFNTFQNDSYIGNIRLCGEPLTVRCSNDGLPKAPRLASFDHDETASRFDWKMAKMGYASGLVIGLSIGYMVLSK
ncbi:receptor-like protein 9DC3 [Citrus sinensis]|uniref:receptor-like protein 9DC3 n=1 Tax=Citrus sinensis TaxID=2711 RepID=UPI002277881E|nr:receptor-like protein 9DC3 [Citrus sinensis]